MVEGLKSPGNAPSAQQVGDGGYSTGSLQKDAQEASTSTKFGDVWNQIQSKYGKKPEKAREIKKTLDKDDFMRIMISQMKNQDPTQPFKAEQMAQELAQFTTVEQLHNMSTTLNKMTTQNQPLERLAMTNLIGKTITVDKDRFPHTEGSNEYLSFNMPKEAGTVSLSIVSETGEVVFQKDMGPMKAGPQSYTWDGKKATTLPAKAGNYIMRIDAKDPMGSAIEVSSQAKARVVGVSFDSSEPVLLIGNIANPEKVTMKNIVRIDAEGMGAAPPEAPKIPGAQSLEQVAAQQLKQLKPEQLQQLQQELAGAGGGAAAAPEAPGGNAGIEHLQAPGSGPSKPNFFSFEKGVGSANLDLSGVSNKAASEAIAKYEAEQKARAAAPVVAEGFPNGIHDGDEEVVKEADRATIGNRAAGTGMGSGSQQRIETAPMPKGLPEGYGGSAPAKPRPPGEVLVNASRPPDSFQRLAK
jgi:flagellar basal-body rod modification protein FlgD